MGLMFNKIIPMDMLAQMPLPFVHRLRDIRLKQLEEQNKQQAQQMQQMKQFPGKRPNGKTNPLPRGLHPALLNETAIDDLMDELT